MSSPTVSPLSQESGGTPWSCTQNPRSPCSFLARSFLGLKSHSTTGGDSGSRRKREFTPDDQKDSTYWVKRRRNNEAARRSRQRRRMEEFLLETRAVELLRENEKLKAALSAVRYRFNNMRDTTEIPEARFPTQNLSKHLLQHTATNPAHHEVTEIHSPTASPLLTNYVVSKPLFRDRFQHCSSLVNVSAVSNHDTFRVLSEDTASNLHLQSGFSADVHNFGAPAPTRCAPVLNDDYRFLKRNDPGLGHSTLSSGVKSCDSFDFPTGNRRFEDLNKTCISSNAITAPLDVHATNDDAPESHTLQESANGGEMHLHKDVPQDIHAKISSQDFRQSQGCESLSSEEGTKNNASATDKLNWIENLPFLPHKLRLKVISTQRCKVIPLRNQNTAIVKVAEAERVHLYPDTGIRCLSGAEDKNKPHDESKLKNSAFQGNKSGNEEDRVLNCSLTSSEHFIPPGEQGGPLDCVEPNLVNDKIENHLSPLFSREFPSQGFHHDGREYQRAQSDASWFLKCPAKDTRDKAEAGHLRNQLASLCAEVAHLKQMLLAKSPVYF
ncbi:NFIL3 protein, partial [Atractosteus spatula]|nr:NFIL3 protein [Atractosteus spatula]